MEYGIYNKYPQFNLCFSYPSYMISHSNLIDLTYKTKLKWLQNQKFLRDSFF
jgi:hypothetical protein